MGLQNDFIHTISFIIIFLFCFFIFLCVPSFDRKQLIVSLHEVTSESHMRWCAIGK